MEILDIIERHWGFRQLRPLQGPAIDAVLARQDSLVVLPTGGGKSLCYQAPAIALAQRGQGATVVVSPLIALMKDQVDGLREIGVAAAQLDSTMDDFERRQTSQDLKDGKLALLFVSPERLVMPHFQQFLREAGVRTFAIDEAHCISHWGHDFRPEYRQLSTLKDIFPGCSVHAFTATATQRVQQDVVSQLRLQNPTVLIGNFDRPNLTYRILPRQDLLTQIAEVVDRHPHEAGIIYCLRRRDVDDYTKALTEKGRHALGYHAGMTGPQRHRVQDAFLQEKCDLIVATVAFGMGIDRSNIRFVIHAAMPKSIEAYQQETGRAGRDSLEAECVLFYSGADLFTLKRLIEKSVAEAQAAGNPVSPDFVNASILHLEGMDRYCRSAVCRHKALVEHFGQPYTPPTENGCGACDHCLGDTEEIPDATILAQKILSAVARTGERFGIGHVMAVLRGSQRERVLQLGHDKLSVYGLLQDHEDRELRDFIYQLISQGVLDQASVEIHSGTTASILKLNPASWEVMRGKRSVRLVQPVRGGKKKPESRTQVASWEGVDESLFQELRELRRDLAAQRGVPPYLVFSDNTLRDLARIRPTTRQNMKQAYGVGQRNFDDFGDRVLQLIARFCRAPGRDLSTDNLPGFAPAASPASAWRSAPAVAVANNSSEARKRAFEMFRRGAAVDDVAAQVQRAASTTWQYLVEFIAAEAPPTVRPWVPDATYARVQETAARLGIARIKPIYLELGESVPYELVRITLAHLAAAPPVIRAWGAGFQACKPWHVGQVFSVT